MKCRKKTRVLLLESILLFAADRVSADQHEKEAGKSSTICLYRSFCTHNITNAHLFIYLFCHILDFPSHFAIVVTAGYLRGFARFLSVCLLFDL